MADQPLLVGLLLLVLTAATDGAAGTAGSSLSAASSVRRDPNPTCAMNQTEVQGRYCLELEPQA